MELIHIPIQFNYLEYAVETAKLIIKNQSVIFSDGRFLNNGFLWNTNVIFEKFTKLVTKEICKKNGALTFNDNQVPLYTLGNEASVNIKKIGYTYPDIRIYEDDKLKWLLDAKYKIWNTSPKNSDIYQMISGAQATKARQATLIYPSTNSTPSDQMFYNINSVKNPKFVSCIFINLLWLAEKDGFNKIVCKFENDLLNQR